MHRFPIVWLTGNTGAGKTTLACGARAFFNDIGGTQTAIDRRIIVLDGDEMRASISTQEGLSAEDRTRHNLRVARLASVLQSQGFLVIVAVIAPFAAVRAEIASLCDPRWVYVKRTGLDAPDRPYEIPEDPQLVIDNDALSVDDARCRFIGFLLGLEPCGDIAVPRQGVQRPMLVERLRIP